MATKMLRQLVRESLIASDYDGLSNVVHDCACKLDDLMPGDPCDVPGLDCKDFSLCCQVGYLAPCDCGEHEFHVVPDKLVVTEKDGG